MATIKSYTDLQQSKKLAEILSLESADMVYVHTVDLEGDEHYDIDFRNNQPLFEDDISAWSLAALLKYLSEIKPQVYTPVLFPSESKWILQFVEYGNGNVCEVSCDNPVDACYEMILLLHTNNLL